MTTIMPTPIASGRAEWQSSRDPRLSYHDPLPTGDILAQRKAIAASPPKKSAGPGLSIREIRDALPREPSTLYTPQVSAPMISGQKSKKSFLGNLFVKEPSMAALDLVTHQMMNQHGAISPTTIPHVSSQKMPDYVPRVNSKWDGVPDHVRTREKQEKERMRSIYRNSLRPMDSNPYGAGFPEDSSIARRCNSNNASTADSWDSRSTGSRPVFHDNVSMRPESVYSTSSSDSIQATQRQASGFRKSISFQSNHKSSERSSNHASETLGLPKGPQRLQSSQSTWTQSTCSSQQSRPDRSPRFVASPIDTVSEYTLPSTLSPSERSLGTPTRFADDEKNLNALLKREAVLSKSVSAQKTAKQPTHNYLTSEATPVGASKNTSRPGLRLQTTNLVAPWESQEVQHTKVKSPQSSTVTSPRHKGSIFGRGKK